MRINFVPVTMTFSDFVGFVRLKGFGVVVLNARCVSSEFHGSSHFGLVQRFHRYYCILLLL